MCFGAISVAKERIWITTPYFIPDEGIYEALKTAAVSGVDVRIIIPDRADSRFVKWRACPMWKSCWRELPSTSMKRIHPCQGAHCGRASRLGRYGEYGYAEFFCNFELTAVLFDQRL